MKDNCKAFASKQDTMASFVKEYGIETLSNEHLISAILGIDALNQGYEQVTEIFNGSRSLRKVSLKTFDDLTNIKGIGEKKAIAILAAFEIGKRLMKEKSKDITDLGSSISVYQHMLPFMKGLEHEEFWVLLMNNNFKLIKKVRLSVGGLTECAVDVRMIIKEAVINNATIISVCHNHPSENATPSKLDDELTRKIAKACEVMRIFFCDHVIIANESFYSYHDKGKL